MRSEIETWEWVEARAAELRLNPTPAELALLEPLKALGFKFQEPLKLIGLRGRVHYIIADYYNPEHEVIVEVDGSAHRKQKGRDGRRDRAASYGGKKTVRVTNKEALKGTALGKIEAFLLNGKG